MIKLNLQSKQKTIIIINFKMKKTIKFINLTNNYFNF